MAVALLAVAAFGLRPRSPEPPSLRPISHATKRSLGNSTIYFGPSQLEHRIELFGRRPNPTQAEIFAVGIAHHTRGEIDLARRAFERVTRLEATPKSVIR